MGNDLCPHRKLNYLVAEVSKIRSYVIFTKKLREKISAEKNKILMTREDTEWAGICQSNAVPTISRTQLREGKGLKATSWFPVQKERRELGLISEAQRGGRESFPLSLSWVI